MTLLASRLAGLSRARGDRPTLPPASIRPLSTGLALSILLASGAPAAAQGNASVDLWYGSPQSFGSLGNPQRWVNVLGNVADPEGVFDLWFTLNGGPINGLNVGSNDRRLWGQGDFNVEIDYADLFDGPNVIEIHAIDLLGDETVRSMTLDYTAGTVWPTTYTADWSSASQISDVAQVVDGIWTITPDGLRTIQIGYDRTFVVGDVTWDDFEVTVPITIHCIDDSNFPDSCVDPLGFGGASGSPGIGFTGRWQGHTRQSPSQQPANHWLPAGAGPWLNFGNGKLSLSGSEGMNQVDPFPGIDFDVRYIWKLRVEGQADGSTFYACKVWQDGQPEPAGWELSGTESPDDLQNGSVIFIAHHVDATFGDVEIVDLSEIEDPPVISNLVVTPGPTEATVTWQTDVPATSRVDFGLDSGYGSTVQDPGFVTEHALLLPRLDPETTYHYQVVSSTSSGSLSSTPDATFTTDTVPPVSAVVSDDFSAPCFDPGVWTFINPLSDSSVWTNGYQAQFSVSSADTHDVWTSSNTLPRLSQSISDTDFEVEAEYDSFVSQGFQSVGILVEQTPTNVLRIEFHRNTGSARVYIASIFNGSATNRAFFSISDATPKRLRVRRDGDQFTISYSLDGATWLQATSFSQAMVVNAVAVYAGNGAGTPHLAAIDYFFNNASPIDPEDGGWPDDCNANGIDDDTDIAMGTSLDVDGNGVPDECQTLTDCNSNGTADGCDIASGTSADANFNGIPDECELVDCNGNGIPDATDIAQGTSLDCNHNGIPDECDIAAGTSDDCDSNGIPDECQPDCDADGLPDACEADCTGNGVPDDCEALPDCNGNGVPDSCDIDAGTSADGNANGVPDECETDCNGNGTPDDVDISSGTSQDCDANGVPDECQPDCDGDGVPDACEADCDANGTPDDCETFADCNANGVPDSCDIDAGTSADGNANGIPDECETDCNGNGTPDDLDISSGTSQDCDANGVPDECQPDCDGDGVPDACEADCDANGTPDDCEAFADCNANGVPDSCDIDAGTSADGNANGIPDECETDCNGNGIPDDLDISSGTSGDLNANGIPDECEDVGTTYCKATPNSTGGSAGMVVFGSNAVADDELFLWAFGMPTNRLGYFMCGAGTGTVIPPGASGPHCLEGGAIVRLLPHALNTGSTGTFTRFQRPSSVPTIGSIAAGETWNFQAWFRDGSSSNFSDATSISFE